MKAKSKTRVKKKRSSSGVQTATKEGFLLVNKPAGITSHDVVDDLRRKTGIARIGHAGTLDPMAAGLLIVGIGRSATRGLSRFLKMDKEYTGQIRLGFVSTTDDTEGVMSRISTEKPTLKELKEIMKLFVGKVEQLPPAYSAIKIQGEPAYRLARAGIRPALVKRSVQIYSLKLLNYRYPNFNFIARVSSGTYIRSLARDIGAALTTGAVLSKLERTMIGPYRVSKATPLKSINSKNWFRHLLKLKKAV